MPADGSVADKRQEAILTALAQLEHTLRDLARQKYVIREAAKREHRELSANYYAGVSDGLLAAAVLVEHAYKTAVMVGGDPAVR